MQLSGLAFRLFMFVCRQKPLHCVAAVDLLSVSAASPQLQFGTKPVHAIFNANSYIGLCLPFDGAQGIFPFQTNLPQAFQQCALVSDHASLHHHC